ncbi:MAG: GAF domain-containing protein [Clostridia bacterium]|nr:GAF domain-containing protein [Clostridia bacterium]
MSHDAVNWPTDKTDLYPLLAAQATALAEGCPLPLPSLANCAALLWDALVDINWAGFYLLKGDTLYLGPFQGKVACTVIPVGRGVCGTGAATREIQLVPDVHAFPGHIACDSASRSEIVLPLVKDGRLLGVMDIDSPLPGRFDQADADGLNLLCTHLLNAIHWEDGLL